MHLWALHGVGSDGARRFNSACAHPRQSYTAAGVRVVQLSAAGGEWACSRLGAVGCYETMRRSAPSSEAPLVRSESLVRVAAAACKRLAAAVKGSLSHHHPSILRCRRRDYRTQLLRIVRCRSAFLVSSAACCDFVDHQSYTRQRGDAQRCCHCRPTKGSPAGTGCALAHTTAQQPHSLPLCTLAGMSGRKKAMTQPIVSRHTHKRTTHCALQACPCSTESLHPGSRQHRLTRQSAHTSLLCLCMRVLCVCVCMCVRATESNLSSAAAQGARAGVAVREHHHPRGGCHHRL